MLPTLEIYHQLKIKKIWKSFLFIIPSLVFGFLLAKKIYSNSISLPPVTRNPVVDENGYTQGHILIVPIRGSGDIGLLNKKGYFEKVWSTKKPTFYGELIDNNKILVVHITKNVFDAHSKGITMPGNTGLIAVYNNKGDREVSFEDNTLHHDIAIKNSSRIFALSWQIKDVQHKGEMTKILSDSIVEIDLKSQKIVRRLTLLDYFDIPNELPKPHKFFRDSVDLFHTNSIDYIKTNPINGNEAILFTMRNFLKGTIALIDLKTNKLLWKSPEKLFSYPHDGKFTKDGTITVFDNGDINKAHSRIIEIEINTNKVIWEYDYLKGKEPIYLKEWKRWNIFSPYISGVQKTKKGYLVTSGMQGKIFEISKDYKIVWELPAAASTFRSFTGRLSTEIFKARQYTLQKRKK